MTEIKTPARADVIALAARRLRDHYGPRLVHLFALQDDPYEPQREAFALYLVAVLRSENYSYAAESHTATALSERINREMNYAYVVTIYTASEDEYRHGLTGSARAAREEGVLL